MQVGAGGWFNIEKLSMILAKIVEIKIDWNLLGDL